MQIAGSADSCGSDDGSVVNLVRPKPPPLLLSSSLYTCNLSVRLRDGKLHMVLSLHMGKWRWDLQEKVEWSYRA